MFRQWMLRLAKTQLIANLTVKVALQLRVMFVYEPSGPALISSIHSKKPLGLFLTRYPLDQMLVYSKVTPQY